MTFNRLTMHSDTPPTAEPGSPHAAGDRVQAAPVQERSVTAAVPDEELFISVQPFETRLALVGAGKLLELHVTTPFNESAVGRIALGKVLRVLPGMQAAFVELGLERPGFLHASDIERPSVGPDGQANNPSDIRKLLHEGQVLPVQVAKDPIATKGARLTTNLAVPSRFLVLTPDSAHVGVSQRITDVAERERLRDLVVECGSSAGLPAGYGFIVRTAAEGVSARELAADMQTLTLTWRDIEARRVGAKTGDVLFRDVPTHVRVLRDLVSHRTRRVCVDDADTHKTLSEFVHTVLPDYEHDVELAKPGKPLFARHDIEQQALQALQPRVDLASGGYLLVEQTEAMTTVDVNTGGFTGQSSLEETIFQTNLEAAEVLPQQLRLRNLGGLVVVDFIDMESVEHRDALMQLLHEGFAGDAARVRIGDISDFGLVELSRKRTRESLVRQFCEPCKSCSGTGVVRRPQSVVFEVLRALAGSSTSPAAGERLVIASAPVIDALRHEHAEHLAQIAKDGGVTVRLQANEASPADHWELLVQ